MAKVRYIRSLDQVPQLSDIERTELAPVTKKFQFRSNSYYLGLIDWNDPDDPIRRIAIPDRCELQEFGQLDASNEQSNYVAPGCQHKYPHTALLLCNETCGTFCRFCFRKRLFQNDNHEAVNDVMPGIAYIKEHEQITNVLLSGGDPLLLSTRRLENILRALREIDHVGIIRIGTKMTAFNPWRILDDPDLVAVLSRFSTRRKRIYVINHFNVARELTEPARQALDRLHSAGIVLVNQSPLLRGINDSPDTLAELMRELSFVGVPPYYFFQCRPTEGNSPYELSLTEAYLLLEAAQKQVSGLAKRARLVMSHATGKIEMVGLTDSHIYLRYHRARNQANEGRFMAFHRDDRAYWFDDLVPANEASVPVGWRGTHVSAVHYGQTQRPS